MLLKDDIANWDSKDTKHIKRVYATHYEQQGFHEFLISLFPSIDHQDGATWLLKHAIDSGDLVPESIDPVFIENMCTTLESLIAWPAQLHVLQILTVVLFPDSCADPVEDFARSCMNSKKTFVRAWSHSVLYSATRNDPSKHKATIDLLEATLHSNSTPASVKARIRNTLKS
jgi:hypothetical protein